MKLFEFTWRRGKNKVHVLPENATIFVEGLNGRRLGFSVLYRSPKESALKISEFFGKRKLKEPRVFWQVGDGPEHDLPLDIELTVYLHKNLHAYITMRAFLCGIDFYGSSSRTGQEIIAVQYSEEFRESRSDTCYPTIRSRKVNGVRGKIWSLGKNFDLDSDWD